MLVWYTISWYTISPVSVYSQCEFQETPMNLSNLFRCGLLWIASYIRNWFVFWLLPTKAHCPTDKESVGFQKQLFAKVSTRHKNHVVICANIPRNLSVSPEYKDKHDCFCMLTYCQWGIWYPCCAWQCRAEVLVATGHVLCNPAQMESSSFRQPTAHCAIYSFIVSWKCREIVTAAVNVLLSLLFNTFILQYFPYAAISGWGSY